MLLFGEIIGRRATILLPVFTVIKYFKRIFEGRNFVIYTDHRPLTFAPVQHSDKAWPRQSGQLDFISEFDGRLQYTPDAGYMVADALSRVETISMAPARSARNVSETQAKDIQLPHLLAIAHLKLRSLNLDGHEAYYAELVAKLVNFEKMSELRGY